MKAIENIGNLKKLVYHSSSLKTQMQFNYLDRDFTKTIDEILFLCKSLENSVFSNLVFEVEFYQMYAQALFDFAEIEKRKQGLIEGNSYNKNILYCGEEKNQNLFTITDALEKSVDYTIKIENLNRIQNMLVNEEIELNKKFRRQALNGLGNINILYLDVEKGIDYLEQSAILGSINSASMLVYIYLQEDYLDYEKAISHFKIVEKAKHISPYHQLYLQNVYHLSQYYFLRGDYDNALILLTNLKQNISNFQTSQVEKEKIAQSFEKLYVNCKNKLAEYKNSQPKIINLEKYLSKETLSIMSNDEKIFIETSLNIFEYISSYNEKNNATLDFSSATMPIMKAVELILYKIFADNYLNYLKKIRNLDLEMIDNCFKTKSGQLATVVDHFEYGSAIKLCAKSRQWFDQKIYFPNQYFINYCNNLGIADAENFIITFCNSLDFIRTLRNKSAHKNRILKSDAEESLNYLITTINFIGFLYDNFGKILK